MATASSTNRMETAAKGLKKINSGRSKSLSDDENASVLLPGLPNHLAQLCLSTLHPSLLYPVCRPWRRLIYSPSFPPFFSLYSILSPISPANHHSNSVEFFCLDPMSSAWQRLPSPPLNPPLRLLHRHPSFISRNLPIQSVAVSGRLVLIAATDHQFLPALSRPLVFDPLSHSNHWLYGPPLPTPRRWCSTGSMDGAIYVASGAGSLYQGDVARSMEKWDMNMKDKEWKWEKMAALKDGRFSREAVEAVGYRGKLYMVNVKGNAVKQGGVYDVAANRWDDMPKGMLAGWNGPAAAAMDGRNDMFVVVDEVKGGLAKYDPENDQWEVLVESSEELKGAEQLVAAGRGRVCAVCTKGGRILVVDVAVNPPRTWVVNPPPEMEVIDVHMLPRMSISE